MVKELSLIVQEAIQAVKSRLDHFSWQDDEAKETAQDVLREFVKIAYGMIQEESADQVVELLGKIHHSKEKIQKEYQELLECHTTQLFAEGTVSAILEVAKSPLKDSGQKWVLQSTAMEIYQDARSLAIQALIKDKELPSKEIESKSRELTRFFIKEYKKENAFKATKAPKGSFSSKEPPINSLLQWVMRIWDNRSAALPKDEHKQDEKAELPKHHPLWLALALIGPFVFLQIGDQLFQRDYALIFFLFPIGIMSLFLLQPKIQRGLFHLSTPRLFGIALLTTLLAYLWDALPWMRLAFCIALLALFLLEFRIEEALQAERDALKQSKEKQSDLINPNLQYEKLGVDTLKLEVGFDLLVIADPDQDGQLLGKIAGLRSKLRDTLGYILPSVRILDSNQIDADEYRLCVKNVPVAKGLIYPGRYMLPAHLFKGLELSVPQSAIADLGPGYSHEPVYWLNRNDIPEPLQNEGREATDVLIAHVQEAVIQYAGQIISYRDTLKLLELVKQREDYLSNQLIPKLLSVSDLQRIVINLIREKVSIKDVFYLLERLLDESRFEKKPDFLSEKLRLHLREAICTNIVKNENKISAFYLSSSWESQLLPCLEKTHYGSKLRLEEPDKEKIAATISSMFQQYQQTHHKLPVLVCKQPQLRLPLFRLLSEKLPHVTVLSVNEIAPGFQIEGLGTLEAE